MKAWTTNHTVPCLAEITLEALKLQHNGSTLELALERQRDGRLESNCKQAVSIALHKFIHKSALQPRVRVWCAVNARGLSLRRLIIPVAEAQERQRLLQLQVESEFPLPPEELAWGSTTLNGAPPRDVSAGQEQVLIAAVRRQVLDDYFDIFLSAGAMPVFIPAALARVLLLPEQQGRIAHLEVGPRYSELIQLENGIPTNLRTIAWGAKDLAQALPERSAPLPQTLSMPGGIALPGSLLHAEPATPLRAGATALAGMIRNGFEIQKLFFSGLATDRVEFARILGEELGVPCEALPLAADQQGTMALSGLARATQANIPILRLNLEADPKREAPAGKRQIPIKWAAAALGLFLLAALFPYFEALACKPGLARKLAALKSDRGRLAAIDSELEFLRFVKQTQPPYLDALYLVSRALPPGSRFDSVSMTRRGELSLRGSLRDANQVADFRSKLLDSGLFSTVAIEEQTPSPDRQKLNIRMSAVWKPDQATRDAASLFAAKEPERPKSPPAGTAPGMMPPGMQSFPPSMTGPGGPGSALTFGPGAMPAGGPMAPPGVSSMTPAPAFLPGAIQATSTIPQTSAPVQPAQPPDTAPSPQP